MEGRITGSNLCLIEVSEPENRIRDNIWKEDKGCKFSKIKENHEILDWRNILCSKQDA